MSLSSVRLPSVWVIMLGATMIAATPPAADPPSDSDLPKGVEFVTSVEDITEYRLGNGLQVLLFPDPSKQTTTVNITYLVGSKHENYGETGMAHLLEHLVFKGSTNHPDIPNELTAHGCRPNGSTWVDRTNYFETFAATEENLEWALDLEADRMVNSFIAKKDLDSEMTVVRNEFEVGENYPMRILEERVYSTAYLWHNYGNTTIGARSDIENVPIEKLQAFYRKWYRPDNAMLVVAGKFDTARTLELIQEKFGPIPRPDVRIEHPYTTEPAQDGERTVTLRRVGDTQAVGLAYHVPSALHPDFPAVQALAFLLADTPSGALHKALVETNMAATIRANADQFADPGLLYISAEVRLDRSLDAARDEMIRVVEQFAETPPPAEDVERARTSLLRDWEVTLRNSQWAAIRLSEWRAQGDWRLMFLHRDNLKAVTPRDVHRVAMAYLIPTNLTVGLYIPTEKPARAEIPESPAIAEILGGYAGGEAMAQGEDFDPTPENIESRVIREALPGGLKLVLLPKKTRGETVNLSMSLRFGDEESLRGKARAGEITARMLNRGTKGRSRQQIEDEIDRLKARVFVWGSATGVTGTIEASREHFPDALRLLADLLRNPTFPESELAQLREEVLLQLEESKSDPRSCVWTAFSRHMRPWPRDDVRYTATPDEEIAEVQELTRDELVAFHADFYGATHGEIGIAGDFDPDEIRTLASDLFGGWKNRQPYTRLVSEYQDRPPVLELLETPDKESASFRAGQRLKILDDDPAYPALVLGNFMTGGGFLNSRLATRIRRTEGLSYGVGSFLRADRWDEDGEFGAYAIYAPENDDKLLTAFRDEMASILKDGFTDEEIDEAKSGWLQSQKVSRSQDRELAQRLARREHEGRTFAWDAALEQKIAALTHDEILAAMRDHIDLDKISIVRAGDFAGAGETAGEEVIESVMTEPTQ